MSKSRWYFSLSVMFLFVSLALIWGIWLTINKSSTPPPLPTLAELSDAQPEPVNTLTTTETIIKAIDTIPHDITAYADIIETENKAIDIPQEPVLDQYVIELPEEQSIEEFSATLATLNIEVVDTLAELNRMVVIADPATIEQLAEESIISTEPDYYASALLTLPPSDPFYQYQWNLSMINAQSAWEAMPDVVTPIRVAIIDSGMCFDHPDMQGLYSDFQRDYVDNDTIPTDMLGHGCSVTGVIASQNNNIGGIGIAPFVEIMPLRALDENGIGTYSDIAQAIVDATNQGAQIINLSLGGTNPSTTLKSAINYALNRDVYVVAATGNYGQSTPLYPAAYDGVIAVGSVNSVGVISSFSNRGEDSLAPGEAILVPYLNNNYTYLSGTSLAAPHVAGVIALDLALNREPIINDGIIQLRGMVSPTEEPTQDATELVEFVGKDGKTYSYVELTEPIKTDRWAVHVQSNADVDSLAAQLGFTNLGQVGELENYYIFVQDGTGTSEAQALSAGQALSASSQILSFEQEVILERELRAIPTDPLVGDQWHLINQGQTGGTSGYDVNVEDAWNGGYDGTGVTIAIVDDGMEITHPDLASKYIPSASHDFNGSSTASLTDEDSNPSHESSDTGHGTSVTGVAGADDDGVQCGVGVAYNANLSGLRLIGSGHGRTDSQEATAFNYAMQTNDIYNNSWGPFDTGNILEGPDTLANIALESGVLNGRGNKGVVYVWASGNGAQNGDHANADGYANSRYTIAVGATDDTGEKAFYSESGTNLLVTAPGGPTSTLDPDNEPEGIVTTDRTGSAGFNSTSGSAGNCTNGLAGTSFSSPIVAGVVALMLDANPNLTWRDVQHILVESSFKNDPTDSSWNINAAGHDFNMKYGFGTVDASAAVALAETWTNVAPEVTSIGATYNPETAIPDTGEPTYFHHIHSENLKIESVELTWEASHSFRGDLYFVLISPSGTVSPIYLPRGGDFISGSFDWTATSMEFWGEESAGVWTLAVLDVFSGDSGTLNSFSLKINGTTASTWDGSLRVGSIEGFRYAVEQVNANVSYDTITLNPWQEYVFEDEYGSSGSTLALPALNTELTINGNNAIVRRLNSGNLYRFMRVMPGAELTLNDMNLSDFRGWNGSGMDRSGGVIYSDSGELTINNSTLSGDSTEDGGAIYAYNTPMTIISSSLIGDGENGGAIFFGGSVSGMIVDSTISGTATSGGAIYNTANLVLHNVTVRDSDASFGGGIYNNGYLRIPYSSLFNNSSSEGGAIFNDNTGDIWISYTEIFDNVALTKGGAIRSDIDSSVQIYDSDIHDNRVDADGGSFPADSGGGAIWMEGSSLGEVAVSITATSFMNNASINNIGGAFYAGNDVSIILAGVSFTGNSATAEGGAIYNDGAQINAHSTEFTGNSASDGGAIFMNDAPSDWIQLFRVLFNENFTTSGHGGAIHTYDGGTIIVINGTMTHNSAYGNGGAVYFRGNGDVHLQFTTITENIADSSNTGLYDGGGLYNEYASNYDTVSLIARNSIIANNIDNSPSPNNFPDCVSRVELIGNNIIEDLSGCTLAGSGVNTSGVDPELGPLQFNGGFFDTHAIPVTSPARDAVTNCTYQVISNPTNLTLFEDARYIWRPQGAACDIGAFELTTTFPADPTNLLTTAMSYNSVKLDWTDNASDETHYVIERSALGQNSWVEIGRVAANVTTYTDTTLICDNNFDYRVFAFRASDNRYSENPTSTVTGSSWVCPLDAPTNVTVSTVLYLDELDVNWLDTNNDESEFRILRSITNTGGFTQVGTAGVDATTFTDSTVPQCYTEYFYQVQAYRAVDGESSLVSNTASGTTSCSTVTPPDSLVADGTEDVMDLTWADQSPDESNFEIQRSISGANSWSTVGSVGVNVTAYTDLTTACGSEYDYRVRAYRSGDTNYSAFSPIASATQACAPPPAPSNLTLIALPFSNDIQVDWADNSNSETDFYIERSTNGSSGWSQIGTVTEDVTTYTDTDASLDCYTPYHYRIQAYRSDDGETSAFSASNSISTWCDPIELINVLNPIVENVATSDMSGIAGFPQPSCGTTMNHAYVWEFPATGSDVFNLNTFGSSIDTILSIWNFDGANFYQIACNDDSALDGTSALTATFPPGSTYIVIVGGKSGANGNITLNSSVIVPPTFTPIPTNTPIPTATETPNLTTVGVVNNGIWSFRNSNSTGLADVTFRFGSSLGDGWQPIVGDWDGDGNDGIGLYKNGRWFLREVAGSGSSADYAFRFGTDETGWQPIVGDWDGDGIDGIGLYKNGVWMLRNTPSNGNADFNFRFSISGISDAIAISGDWHDEAIDRVGLYHDGRWYLSRDHRTNADAKIFRFGPTDGTWLPIVGDWDMDGDDTIGVFKDGGWRLRNNNSQGNADFGMSFGNSDAIPVAGYRGGVAPLALFASVPDFNQSPTVPTEEPIDIATATNLPTLEPVEVTEEPSIDPTGTATATMTQIATIAPTITPSSTWTVVPTATATQTATEEPPTIPENVSGS